MATARRVGVGRSRPVKPVPSDRAVRLSDMTPEGARAAKGIIKAFGANMPGELSKRAGQKRQQAVNARAKGGKSAGNADAYDAAATRGEMSAPIVGSMKRRPTTIDGMASNNVDAVEAAATTHRMTPIHPLNGRRTNPESLAGTGWYHDANTSIREAVPEGFGMDKAVSATSKLSQGTKPEDERGSMGAAAHAIHNDVKLDVTAKMNSHWASQKLASPAPTGGKVSYASLSGQHAAVLAEPKMRKHMEATNPQVDWHQLGRAASTSNRAVAHDVLNGTIPPDQAQNALTSPKTKTYTNTLAEAVSGTPHEKARAGEYRARGAHLGDLIRGDVSKGQGMLDLHGQRHDTGTFNGPRYSTPQDSWQMGSHNAGLSRPEVIKATGDIAPGSKSHNGVSAHPDARVKASSVTHAVHDEATMRAADMLTKKYDPGYAVPSALVQETGWTGVRRVAGADSVYNKNQRDTAALAKPPKVNRNAHFAAGAEKPKAPVQLELQGVKTKAQAEAKSPTKPSPAPPKQQSLF